MRMTDIIRRTFHGTKGITTSVPACTSSATTSRLKAATPWPRRTASLIDSHVGKAKRRVGTMPRVRQGTVGNADLALVNF